MKWAALGALILAVIYLLVQFGFLPSFVKIVNTTASDEICRDSVILMTKSSTAVTESPFDLQCKSQRIASKSTAKEQIKSEIAGEMYRCWWRYGEGQLDFYSDWDFGESDTHCLICARLDFVNEPAGFPFGEFGYYLSQTKLPGQEKTFVETFTGVENSRLILGSDGGNLGEHMTFEDPLYVVYRINKHNGFNQDVSSLFSSSSPSAPNYADYRELKLIGGYLVFGTVSSYSGNTDDLALLYEKNDGSYVIRGSANLEIMEGKVFSSKDKANVYASQQGWKTLSTTGFKSVLGRTISESGRAAVGVASFGEQAGIRVAESVGGEVIEKGSVKLAGTVATKAGTKLGTRAIPVVGWALAIYDVTSAVAVADELYPSVALYSANDISQFCDSLD